MNLKAKEICSSVTQGRENVTPFLASVLCYKETLHTINYFYEVLIHIKQGVFKHTCFRQGYVLIG